jgi:arylsulfatase A-like enzyme
MMRVDLRDSEAPGVSALFAGVGTAITIGLAEWTRAAVAANATPVDLQRGLLLVCAVYGAIGAAAGLACWALRRVPFAPVVAIAAIAALWVAGADGRPIVRVAALALGAVLLRIGALVLERFPTLPRARLASSAALLSIAGVCALAARALPAYGPRWALGAAVAAAGAAVLVWTPRVRGSALLFGAGALALVWQGANHVQRLAPSAKPDPEAPSVLFVTIDTLRADRVGAYGYAPARTPVFDALARDGVLFKHAFSHSRFTGPSHISILTGLLPTTSGSVVNMQPLAKSIPTLAESFARAGYVTAAFPSAFTTLESATSLPGRFQFADEDTREFSTYPEAVYRCVAVRAIAKRLKGPATWSYYRPAAPTTDRARRFLEAQAGTPTFTWVHYFDPHVPYRPPAELRRADANLVDGEWYDLSAARQREIIRDPARMNAMLGLYDAEIAYADRELGRLVEAARAHSPRAGVLIVVTSDHGEPMGEHGHYWVRDLHDETLHVPLVFVPPRKDTLNAVVDADVRLVDLAPTLLDYLKLPALARSDGASLVPHMTTREALPPRVALGILEPGEDEPAGRGVAVRLNGWKLIAQESFADAARSELDLFHVLRDPKELVDRSAEYPELVAKFQRLVPSGWPTGETRALSDAERERLRALGYVE